MKHSFESVSLKPKYECIKATKPFSTETVVLELLWPLFKDCSTTIFLGLPLFLFCIPDTKLSTVFRF